MPLGFPPSRFKPPLDRGPFRATSTRARLTDALASVRATQTYDTTISSGDPTAQLATVTQTYDTAVTSGDPTLQLARPTQTYDTVVNSGDPSLQLARPTQTYLTVIWDPIPDQTPIIKTRPLHAPLNKGPFRRTNPTPLLASHIDYPIAARARSYGFIF